MTEIAIRDAQPGTLALTGDQIEWSPVQQAALEHIGIADAPAGDQQVFLHVAQRVGLDPFAKQIYMIPRQEGSGRERKTKWTIQTAIDGFRLIASRSPHYRGQIGPQWCGDDGAWRDVWVSDNPPIAARVGVLRDDFTEPIWGVAMFREYAQTTTYDGNTRLTKMWREKSAHMIAKCAEALGLRKAFPNELSGLYTDDEMAHADSPGGRRVVVEQAPAAVTAAELTGTLVNGADPGPPAAPPAPAVDDAGRMTAPQSKKLFALLREGEIDDRFAWASGLLGREITTYGQLSVADAGHLIDQLESVPAAERDATDHASRDES